MRRLQLFEFEDFEWVPRSVRDGGTDMLDLGFRKVGFYDGVASRLVELLDATKSDRVVDLCSGGGGGTLQMREAVAEAGRQVAFEFTDRFPNESGIERVRQLGDPKVVYLSESVDAMKGGGDREGVRTMSGALHHFPPEKVKELIAGVVARGTPLAFFDVAASPAISRLPLILAPIAMAVNMVALFVGSLFLIPLVRPVRASRLVFTYLLPLIPILVAWDGRVSRRCAPTRPRSCSTSPARCRAATATTGRPASTVRRSTSPGFRAARRSGLTAEAVKGARLSAPTTSVGNQEADNRGAQPRTTTCWIHLPFARRASRPSAR